MVGPSGLGGTDRFPMPLVNCIHSIRFLDPDFRERRVTRYGVLRRTDLNSAPLGDDEVDEWSDG